MQIALLILQQMIQFFLMVFMGYLLVKTGLRTPGDSKTLSIVTVYLVLPCVVINAFQIEYTPETAQGLLLAAGAALTAQILFLIVIAVCGKIFGLNQVEKASIMYPNAGNLTLPIVLSVLGPEWVVYSSVFVAIQQIFIWTHGKALLCGEKGVEWKKILTNVNILSILAGIALFLLRFQLPEIITQTMNSFSALLAPVSMVIIGMLAAGRSLGRTFCDRRIYLTAAIRLVLCPLLTMALTLLTGVHRLLPDGDTILFITLLACAGPAAATVTQQAQVYGADAEYAGAVNVVTTALCLVTMPVMAGLYWVLIG